MSDKSKDSKDSRRQSTPPLKTEEQKRQALLLLDQDGNLVELFDDLTASIQRKAAPAEEETVL